MWNNPQGVSRTPPIALIHGDTFPARTPPARLEAAKHLSTVLGEEVAITDIYRLALDGHLVLSMSFPNHAYGNLGEVVGIKQAKRFMPPAGMLDDIYAARGECVPEEIVIADYIGNDQFINWSEKVNSIEGVWDLPMLASEKLPAEFAGSFADHQKK